MSFRSPEKISTHTGIFLLLMAMISISAKGAEPEYQFSVTKPEDSITVTNYSQRTTFVATSKSGIGSGSISLSGGAWPKNVTLQLKGFKNLENLNLVTSRLLVHGSIRQSGKMPFYLADASGKFDPEDRPAGYLAITVERRDDGLEIILPANLLLDSAKFEVRWIDAFR